jgi:Spy/CpxP family protein refolding chaperone
MMKKTLIALATLLAVTASIPAAMAQPGYGAGPGSGMRGGPNVEYMATVLDLTPEQQAKMKALYTEQAERRAQMRAAMQAEMQTKLQGILTKDQYAKMQELRKLRMDSRGAGMGPGAGGRGQGRGIGCPGFAPQAPANTK